MSQTVMRTPRSIDLEITSRCNASCKYCYYLNNPGVDYRDLPKERWLDFFAELQRCQVMEVTLLGGEPLLREDFLELVDGIVVNQMRFSLLTNGSLMTSAIANHLMSTGRCNMVQVSLDGSSPSVHESLRGPGSFAPALAAIRQLQEVGLPVTVRVTIHPGNVDDLTAIASLLLEELELSSFSTNAASSLGDAGKYPPDVLLRPEQRLQAMHTLAELDQAYPGRIHANAGPLADWRNFQQMEAACNSGEAIPGRGRLVGCGCVFGQIAVRSDGAITPCVMLPQMVLGHIGKDNLATIWQSSPDLEQMRKRYHVELKSFEECCDCVWLQNCTGNCPGTAYTRTGEINHPCPDACMKRFISELDEVGLSI